MNTGFAVMMKQDIGKVSSVVHNNVIFFQNIEVLLGALCRPPDYADPQTEPRFTGGDHWAGFGIITALREKWETPLFTTNREEFL